jgi:phosphatidylglycerol:prolipoprotein diacylglycerol transferase
MANPNDVNNIVFVGLISGVLGARISFVIQNLDVFLSSLLNIFSLNPGLLDPVGGMAVALISVLIFGNYKNICWWQTLDATTPFLCVLWIAFGLSNLASGNAFGSETSLPWGIEIWGAVRHPTQIYQILAGGIILAIIWPRTENSQVENRVSGETFFGFMALSAGAWLIIEAFRGDSILLSNGIRAAQIVAWIILALSMWVINKLNRSVIQQDADVTDSSF